MGHGQKLHQQACVWLQHSRMVPSRFLCFETTQTLPKAVVVLVLTTARCGLGAKRSNLRWCGAWKKKASMASGRCGLLSERICQGFFDQPLLLLPLMLLLLSLLMPSTSTKELHYAGSEPRCMVRCQT